MSMDTHQMSRRQADRKVRETLADHPGNFRIELPQVQPLHPDEFEPRVECGRLAAPDQTERPRFSTMMMMMMMASTSIPRLFAMAWVQRQSCPA